MELKIDSEQNNSEKKKKKINLKISDIYLESELRVIKELNKSLMKALEEEESQSDDQFHQVKKKAIVKEFVEVRQFRKRELMNLMITPNGIFGFKESNKKMISCLEVTFDRDHEIIFKKEENILVILEKNKNFLSVKLMQKDFQQWELKLKKLQRKLAKRRAQEIFQNSLNQNNKGKNLKIIKQKIK